MKLKKLLKFLDDSDKLLGKLGKVALKVYRLGQLIYSLYKIAAHR